MCQSQNFELIARYCHSLFRQARLLNFAISYASTPMISQRFFFENTVRNAAHRRALYWFALNRCAAVRAGIIFGAQRCASGGQKRLPFAGQRCAADFSARPQCLWHARVAESIRMSRRPSVFQNSCSKSNQNSFSTFKKHNFFTFCAKPFSHSDFPTPILTPHLCMFWSTVLLQKQ